jgi:hypothetical protein
VSWRDWVARVVLVLRVEKTGAGKTPEGSRQKQNAKAAHGKPLLKLSLMEVLKIQFLTANERQWTRIPNQVDLINFWIRILLF